MAALWQATATHTIMPWRCRLCREVPSFFIMCPQGIIITINLCMRLHVRVCRCAYIYIYIYNTHYIYIYIIYTHYPCALPRYHAQWYEIFQTSRTNRGGNKLQGAGWVMEHIPAGVHSHSMIGLGKHVGIACSEWHGDTWLCHKSEQSSSKHCFLYCTSLCATSHLQESNGRKDWPGPHKLAWWLRPYCGTCIILDPKP